MHEFYASEVEERHFDLIYSPKTPRVIVWVKVGQNVSLAAPDSVRNVYLGLKSFYRTEFDLANVSVVVPMNSSGSILGGGTDGDAAASPGDASAARDLDVLPLRRDDEPEIDGAPINQTALLIGDEIRGNFFSFQWVRADCANTVVSVCSGGPCVLSLFAFNRKDEGDYDLVLTRRSANPKARVNVFPSIVISSVSIKISGEFETPSVCRRCQLRSYCFISSSTHRAAVL
jgi:hypothetical protein